ncbi:hypothetical protein [Variovorax sp. Sphag1AA]|uniref:hypothetical protein n=1 Tax=Variovorax sp. Sphag1AA TaxID=2587027 RepID=UPI001612C460|nr:hypothetical protein [Variovorax sp. Sphag1AA]MBB3178004.1 hypothetical protein [Variovorax sp. Sphag1AA]
MFSKSFVGLALLAALLATPAMADDGHNHGAAPSALAGPVFPRFAAASELFELVGMLNGKQLTVYVDRFDDNAPVKAAHVELEIGGAKVTLKERADGEFEGTLASDLAEGVTPVTATIAAGGETDILAADLDIHGDVHDTSAQGRSPKVYAAGVAVILAVLFALVWLRHRVSTAPRAGGAA